MTRNINDQQRDFNEAFVTPYRTCNTLRAWTNKQNYRLYENKKSSNRRNEEVKMQS